MNKIMMTMTAGLFALGLVSSSNSRAAGAPTRESFGTTPEGKSVEIYTLRNAAGAELRVMTYGGTVVSLKVPDKDGKMGDVVLGHETFDGYMKNNRFLGCIVGRYANRIANGKFELDGHTYTLAQNNGSNNLHGGPKGFDTVVWDAKPVDSKLGPAIELSHTSNDGDQGFPGNLKVTATYTLTEDNSLRIDYHATTDKPTVCNLSHHSYFNLAGKGDVLSHEVMIAADKFTPVDKNLIPTGEMRPVKGTPFDFTAPEKIGTHIADKDDQLTLGGGYDHNYVLNKKAGELGVAATVYEPTSGRVMQVSSTEPGLQFYSGNFIGNFTGKYGVAYAPRSGFCMEPGHFPDSPNHPAFPSVTLRPGQEYKNTIIYRFSVKK